MIDPRTVPDSWGYDDFDDEAENHKSKSLVVTYPTLIKGEENKEEYRKMKVSPNFTLFRPGSYKGFIVETETSTGKKTYPVGTYFKALVLAKSLYESCLKDGWKKK